ncbi:outer membrane protein (OmpH-like) [gamma proteobacterium HdN1]|nr:outer membrane protein (OmpH-like) [gamma proteobacterium HdN1]
MISKKQSSKAFKNSLTAKLLAGALLASAAHVSWAAGPARAPIVVAVDLQQVIMDSSEAKAKWDKLKTGWSKDENEFNSARTELGKLQDRYQKDSAVMSADQKRNLEKQIDDKRMQLEFVGKKLQKTTGEARQQLVGEMIPKVEAALKALAAENKYDMVLRKEAVAMLVTPEFDITEDLVKRLNSMK